MSYIAKKIFLALVFSGCYFKVYIATGSEITTSSRLIASNSEPTLARQVDKYSVPSFIKCTDPVSVKIEQTIFSIPRYGVSIRLLSGKELNNLYQTCDVYFLENVASLRMDGWRLQAPTIKNKNTTYDSLSKFVKKSFASKDLVELPDGTRKLNLSGPELYILPQEKAPTANGQPVAFDCQKSDQYLASCYTSYFLPNGLKVDYRFQRSEHPKNNFLVIDSEQRRRIESLIKPYVAKHDEGVRK